LLAPATNYVGLPIDSVRRLSRANPGVDATGVGQPSGEDPVAAVKGKSFGARRRAAPLTAAGLRSRGPWGLGQARDRDGSAEQRKGRLWWEAALPPTMRAYSH
jgi:hypothetical protein